MTNIKAQIAFDLMPLMRHLYAGGILQIDGQTGTILLREKTYHEVFPEDHTPQPNHPSSVYPWRWSTTIDGVEIYALSDTGVY